MARSKEHMNLATEILSDMKRQFIRCRVALIVSLAVNGILTAAVYNLKRG